MFLLKVLYWLPNNLPSSVYMIVSTRTEHQASMEVLVQEQSFATVEISVLDDQHKETMTKVIRNINLCFNML